MENKKTSQFFFGIFVLLVFCAVIYLFKSYLLVIFIGALLALATTNIQKAFLRLSNGRKMLSATLSTLLLCALFFAPIIYTATKLVESLANIDITQVSGVLDYVKNHEFAPEFNFIEVKIKEFIANLDLAALGADALAYFKEILGKSASFIVDMGFIVVFFFFTHFYASELANYVKKIAPINKNDLENIFLEVANSMSVVFYSTIANAVFQGVLFAIITLIYGFDAVFWGVIYAFCSLIPVIGGALAYAPLCLYKLANGDISAAIIIFIYSISVISIFADNFIKPLVIRFISDKLLKTPTKLNELLIFFAMLAGITSFGFWGIILGPAIVALCSATLRLYAILKEREFI